MANGDVQIEQRILEERLAELLSAGQDELIHAWLADSLPSASALRAEAYEVHAAQARRFLALLAERLRQPPEAPRPFTPEIDAALQRRFPLVYRVQTLLSLASALSAAHHQRWRMEIPPRLFFDSIQQLFATLPIEPVDQAWFTERLDKLNQISWELHGLHNGDAIIRQASEAAPLLVDAESSAVWLWDADQRAPVVLVVGKEREAQFPMPDSLLRLLRQVCDSRCAFSVDPGESEADWPAGMADRPVAFVPLQAHENCIGVLTVHHMAHARFSHDDILLLSALGSIAASALLNVQLHSSERHLVNLLQTSIRQVVRVITSRAGRHEEFTQSMLQVAEGLTRAEAVCAVLEVEGRAEPLVSLTGPLALTNPEALRRLAELLRARAGDPAAGKTGSLRRLVEPGELDSSLRRQYYAFVPVACNGRPVGTLFALGPAAFRKDQTAFLETIGEQIGVGLESMQRAVGMQRLLVELANVNYVSQAITHTFDQQRILALITQAAGQAVSAPIALAGWHEDDGEFHVRHGTATGLTEKDVRKLRLTAHNAVLRKVMDTRQPVTHQSPMKLKAPAFPLLAQKGARSWICLPMIAAAQDGGKTSARVLGVLLLADTREREFSEREMALLSTYANQGALAMANSLLYGQVEEQLRHIRLLYENLSAMTATLELPAILDTLLESTTLALQVPAGLVTLAEGSGSMQHVAAARGLEAQPLAQARFRAGEGIIGGVYQYGEPIESSNLACDGRCTELSALAQREDLVSSYTVPLAAPGYRWGTLTLLSREMHGFTPAEKHLLGAMATQAAVVIQNARAYARERERTTELDQLLARLSLRLPAALALMRRCLEIARQTEPPEEQATRTLARVSCLIALEDSIMNPLATEADVRDALIAAFHDPRCFPAAFSPSQARVSGARVLLPMREAMALLLFLQEWIRALTVREDAPPLAVAFQGVGKEIAVHLDADILAGTTPLANEALLVMAVEMLRGTMAVSVEEGTWHIRLRFSCPPGC